MPNLLQMQSKHQNSKAQMNYIRSRNSIHQADDEKLGWITFPLLSGELH